MTTMLLKWPFRLNLHKEVADGLRVYFDFTLKDLLLYQQEREQYNRVASFIKQEYNNSDLSVGTIIKQEHVHTSIVKQEIESPPLGSPQHQPNISVCSNTSLPLLSPDSNSATSGGDGERRKSLRSHRTQGTGFELTNGAVGKFHPILANIKESASSATSVSSFDTEHNHHNAVSSVVSSPRQDALLSQIMSWKILPSQANRKCEQVLPSQVYGAVHLARLFVKLPELLIPSGISDEKMEILLQRLNEFLVYLETHKEWFEESLYVDASNSIDCHDAAFVN